MRRRLRGGRREAASSSASHASSTRPRPRPARASPFRCMEQAAHARARHAQPARSRTRSRCERIRPTSSSVGPAPPPRTGRALQIGVSFERKRSWRRPSAQLRLRAGLRSFALGPPHRSSRFCSPSLMPAGLRLNFRPFRASFPDQGAAPFPRRAGTVYIARGPCSTPWLRSSRARTDLAVQLELRRARRARRQSATGQAILEPSGS